MNNDIMRPSLKRILQRKEILVNKYAHGILKAIASGNSKLLDFFDDLEVISSGISADKQKEIASEIEHHGEVITQMVEHKKELENKIKKTGLRPTTPIPYELSLGIRRAGNTRIKDTFEIFQDINDCKLRREMLTEEGHEKIRKEYERIKEHSDANDKQEENLRKRLKTITRRIDWTFRESKRHQLRDERDFINSRLEEFAKVKKEKERLEQLLELLDKLTTRQRGLIIEYMRLAENILEEVKKIEKCKRRLGTMKVSKYNEEVIHEAFRRYVSQNNMTEEDLTKFFEMFRYVEQQTDNGAFNTNLVTRRDIEVGKHKPAIIGFLEHLYEPETVPEEHPMITERKSKDTVRVPSEGYGEDGK